MNPYETFVTQFARLVQHGGTLPLGGFPPAPRPSLPHDAPKALIFSPHPDDEVIIGGLPLRLLREQRWNVINVAVTQGSNPARQQERLDELRRCCRHVGFGLIQTSACGLERVNLKTREEDPAHWQRGVERVIEILGNQRPRAIFFPHDDDWNITHIGTHHLVVDALRRLGRDFACLTVETEFWGAMDTPNLMVESGARDVIDLISALTFHVGEVRRNPYHVRLPAWLMDNVRRGGELVGGQGGAAPDFTFATLYRLRRWAEGGFQPVLSQGRFLSCANPFSVLFP